MTEGIRGMKKVKFEKPMNSMQRMAWAVRYKNVPPGIPVPLRVQRDGTNIAVRPRGSGTEGPSRQQGSEDL